MTARLLLLTAFLAASASAQPTDTWRHLDTSATRTLNPEVFSASLVVTTDGAVVYVFSSGWLQGPFAPGEVVHVMSGDAQVAAFESVAAWDALRAETSVVLTAGDTLRVALPLPVRYRVETLPLGATVTLETAGVTRALGAAPLSVDLPSGEAGTLTARLSGYADARAALDGDGGAVSLALRPAGLADGVVPIVLLPTERSRLPRTLIDIGIGALSLAAGAVAVHYKRRADAIDDRYRDPNSVERGSDALRQEAERLDLRSSVALGAMQAGVVVLGLRFVLR